MFRNSKLVRSCFYFALICYFVIKVWESVEKFQKRKISIAEEEVTVVDFWFLISFRLNEKNHLLSAAFSQGSLSICNSLPKVCHESPMGKGPCTNDVISEGGRGGGLAKIWPKDQCFHQLFHLIIYYVEGNKTQHFWQGGCDTYEFALTRIVS